MLQRVGLSSRHRHPTSTETRGKRSRDSTQLGSGGRSEAKAFSSAWNWGRCYKWPSAVGFCWEHCGVWLYIIHMAVICSPKSHSLVVSEALIREVYHRWAGERIEI
ncbi:hypothetical protein ASPTUDRAFT_309818 [Aspergillus tubingensis CBS 134.48]|uniref:Uncharacterized protein n=1 Tax=Aspergillus tubingensis (strain CBS 134.48) TaxID=767770 RepID=A0A1L9NQD7_ASPTC|nr:hypothetical protein ASPTUDRAFT_309818 [Aspergillus tubingensis CBS 134.48]